MSGPLSSLKFSFTEEGFVTFGVVASPGSTRSLISGVLGGNLKVRVRAAPERGKANREIEELIAEALGVGRSEVRIFSGAASRHKRVRVKVDRRVFAAFVWGEPKDTGRP